MTPYTKCQKNVLSKAKYKVVGLISMNICQPNDIFRPYFRFSHIIQLGGSFVQNFNEVIYIGLQYGSQAQPYDLDHSTI